MNAHKGVAGTHAAGQGLPGYIALHAVTQVSDLLAVNQLHLGQRLGSVGVARWRGEGGQVRGGFHGCGLSSGFNRFAHGHKFFSRRRVNADGAVKHGFGSARFHGHGKALHDLAGFGAHHVQADHAV